MALSLTGIVIAYLRPVGNPRQLQIAVSISRSVDTATKPALPNRRKRAGRPSMFLTYQSCSCELHTPMKKPLNKAFTGEQILRNGLDKPNNLGQTAISTA